MSKKSARARRGRPVVIEHKGDKHPQVIIESPEGKILDVHYLPAKARIEVDEGKEVKAGELLARLPRGSDGTQDITGGLPRVTEIFEARKPKDPAAMAEICGTIELKSDKRRGKMTIIIRSEKMEKEHHVPRDRHLNYHTGDRVEAGDALTDGPLVPHDILRIKGEEALQRYLQREIQNVYRAQSVTINDKHVEIILGADDEQGRDRDRSATPVICRAKWSISSISAGPTRPCRTSSGSAIRGIPT